jgi:hypothetical protein
VSWQAKLKADPALAREVALDAAIARGMDRIPSIEPSRDSLARVLEGAGLAPVLSMREARTGERTWWRRHWAIEVGFVAAAMIVVAVLFVLPNEPVNTPEPVAETVDVSDWVYGSDEIDAIDWADNDTAFGDPAYDVAVPGKSVEDDALLGELTRIVMRLEGASWENGKATDVTGLEKIEDWRDILEGLDS